MSSSSSRRTKTKARRRRRRRRRRRSLLLFVAPLLVFAVALLVLLFVVGTEASKSSSWSSFWTRKNTDDDDDDDDDAKGFASIKIEEEESFWKQAKNTTPEVLLRSELSCDACVATSVQIFGQIRHRVEAHERAKTSLGEGGAPESGRKEEFGNLKSESLFARPDIACKTRFQNRLKYSLKPLKEEGGEEKLHLAGPGFDHMRNNPRNTLFRKDVERVLYELCEKSLREHDAIETYKKAVKEGISKLPEGEQARNTNNAVLMSFVTQMCFFPGPNNVDDVENASSEEKRQAEEWSKKQTQYCKGERREERVQNFSDHSLRASNILEEVKRKALTDALENAIDETTGKSNLQVAKRMCLSGKLKETTCSFVRLEFANAVPKLVAQLQNITENQKKLEYEMSQIDEGENFDYDDEDYDGDGDFAERFLEAKKTRLDTNFNYTFKMATTACASWLEMEPNSAYGTHNSATVRRYGKDENAIEDAIDIAKKAIDLHATNEDKMEGYKFISEANHALGRYDEAMKYAQMAKDVIDVLSPERASAYRLLASVHVARTFQEMATGEILTKAARIEKEEIDYREKESGSSKALTNEELDLKRHASNLHDELKENLEAAATMLEDVIWEDPRREHLINMGIALYLLEAANDNALGRFTKPQHDALTEAKKLCLLKPEHMEDHEIKLCRDVLVLTGRKLLKEKLYALAGDALHMALIYDEENSVTWADVGFSQFAIGKLEIAKMCFDNAKKYDPDNFVLPEDVRAALEDVGENELLQTRDEKRGTAKAKKEEEQKEREEEGEKDFEGQERAEEEESSTSSTSSSRSSPRPGRAEL